MSERISYWMFKTRLRRCTRRRMAVSSLYSKYNWLTRLWNSLIIREENTKEIMSVKEFVYLMQKKSCWFTSTLSSIFSQCSHQDVSRAIYFGSSLYIRYNNNYSCCKYIYMTMLILIFQPADEQRTRRAVTKKKVWSIIDQACKLVLVSDISRIHIRRRISV
jgi:hypothetical protein